MAQRSSYPLLAFLLFAPAGPALAEEAPAELGEVQVTAPAEASGAPSAFSTIITPDAARYRFTTVPALLSQAVGTQVRELGGPGQFSTVSIRGSSAEQVAVYLDGVRVNSGGAGAVDLATLSTAGIGRIEVIRGGGTAQFGSDAIGGVVNIVTAGALPGRAIGVEAAGGSFWTVKTGADFRRRTERHAVVLGHTHFQSRGDYSFRQATTTLAGTPVGGGGVFHRDHNRVLADDLLAKFDGRLGAGASVNVTNDFFWTDRQLPGTEAEATLLAPTNPLEATQRIVRNLTHLGARWDDLWTPRLTAALGIANTFEHARFADPSPAVGTPIARTTINAAIAPYLRGEYTWPTARGTHHLMTRYDYRRDLYDDAAGNATTTVTGARGRDVHQFVVQDEWRSPRDRWMLLPVARFADASDFPANASGKLGVAIRPAAPLTLKANIETAHRFPTFTELYYPDEGYLRGNPHLEKESALVWDAGAILTWPAVRVEGAFFQHRIRNAILFVPISATTIQPINTFAARAEGIEASAEAMPWPFLRVTGNYTWLRAHFAHSGLQLPGRPRHAANARIAFLRDFSPRWGGAVAADLHYLSPLPVNTANSVFLAARAALDVGLTATLTTATKTKYFATIEAKDVTNVQIYDARGFPLPRRSFFLTVGARWS